MEEIKLKLIRDKKNKYGLFGKLFYGANLLAFTIERHWLNNKENVSCIPQGVYIFEPYTSLKYPIGFKALKVPNRSDILMHNGNWMHDSKGCILVGRNRTEDMVTNSKDTLKRLCELFPNGFTLVIEDRVNDSSI